MIEGKLTSQFLAVFLALIVAILILILGGVFSESIGRNGHGQSNWRFEWLLPAVRCSSSFC